MRIDPKITALVDRLRNAGDNEAAAFIEWLLDERATFGEALQQERADYERLAKQHDEALARLNRIGDHLRTLTLYAEGGTDDHAPPPIRGRSWWSRASAHARGVECLN